MAPFLTVLNGNETHYVGYLRIRQVGGREITELHKNLSHTGLVATIQNTGFRLPTEDEYEYLVGGGSRSVYRWGDVLRTDIQAMGPVLSEERALEVPDERQLAAANQFGISICFNPYKAECVMESEVLFKGGDGGCGFCGGAGPILSTMPLATYARDWTGEFEDLERDDVTGDYTVARRILRLG
jgi:hypothetical protein